MRQVRSRVWFGRSMSLFLTIVAVACGADGGTPTPEETAPQPTASPTSTPPDRSYSALIAASEFVVGENRFPFGLVADDGTFLDAATVVVRFYALDGSVAELLAQESGVWRTLEGLARPHEHADGTVHLHLDFRGVYVVDPVTLPKPGPWAAQFQVSGIEGSPLVRTVTFVVDAEPTAPGLGERVPATRNATIHDVESFADLSTREVADHMHELSVAQALGTGRPFVVLFSSPQFCVSAMCGPITNEIAAVSEQFLGRADVIHIEPWDLDAARNEGRLVRSAEMAEWRLVTEPWTFVVGADGRVARRFEGLVTREEVAAALEPLL